MATIQKGQKVSFLYSSYLSNGTCVDQETQDPILMVAGLSTKGNLFANVVSNSLIGMTENQAKQVNVPAKYAFGERDEKRVFRTPHGNDPNVRVGDEIEIEVNVDGEPEILEGTIVKIDREYAFVDTNHPLAGQSLTVKIKVISFH